jgi:hypothetical protein
MIYREYLVMRKALAWYAGAVLVLMLINFIWPGAGNMRVSYGTMAVQSGSFAAIFAWIFGVALGNGSREAARVLWVLPSARWKMALQVIGVDLAGITLAFACEYAAILVLLALSGLRFPAELQGSLDLAYIVVSLALAYAVYGWSALIGMLGRRMPYCGILAAPALAIWMTVAQSPSTIGAILRAPLVTNPIAVFNTTIALYAWHQQHAAIDTVSASLQYLGTSWEAPVLIAIALVTYGLVSALWQRAEVIT